MHLVRFANAPEYEAAGHAGVTAHRVQGREAGGPRSMSVSISEYPPGSGGESSLGQGEVVYVVLEGRMRVVHAGEEIDLDVGDSVSFGVGDDRASYNVGDEHARLLVIHQTP